MCTKEDETRSYLFFSCEYVDVVWKGVMGWMNMSVDTSNWQSILQYVQSHCNINNGMHQTQNDVECDPIYDSGRRGMIKDFRIVIGLFNNSLTIGDLCVHIQMTSLNVSKKSYIRLNNKTTKLWCPTLTCCSQLNGKSFILKLP